MPAERPIFFSENLPRPESLEVRQLRRRQEAEHLLQNPNQREVQINELHSIENVSCDVTVSIGPMPTLGGWRIASKEAITNIYDRTLATNPEYIDSIVNRIGINHGKDAQAATLEAWGLATDMALKWAIMRSTMKHTKEHNLFPRELEASTIDVWIEASKLSGGKSVAVNGKPDNATITGDERRSLIMTHAIQINSLNARKGTGKHHITAPDMGTHAADMTALRFFTEDVACMTPEYGGSGDPSPVTAKGVFHGINSMLEFMERDGDEMTFAIQGAAGEVGSRLFKDLRAKYPRAKIVISDIDNKQEALQHMATDPNTKIVHGEEIFDQGGIFIPSGPSAQLNDKHLERMQRSGFIGVNGPANYLYPPGKEEEMEKKYHDAGILVAPAPLVNLGGILSVASEFVNNIAKKHGGQILTEDLVLESARIVGPKLKQVLEKAKAEGKRPDEIFREEALDEFASLCAEYGVIK